MNLNEAAPSDATHEAIADYARRQVRWLRKAPISTGRHVFLLGEALSRVKGATPEGEWAGWLRRNRIPKETARQAVAVFDHWKTVEAIKGRTVMELKRATGLVKPKSEGKGNAPAWIPADAPRVVVKLAADIDAVRGALAELDSMDKAAVAKLAEELADLAKQVAGLAKPAKTKRPQTAAT